MSAPKRKSKTKKHKKVKVELPDLTDIYDAFTDARALVTVACDAIVPKTNAGQACLVLHLGVRALNRVADELEEAEMQFDRFRRKNAKASGGAS